MTAFLDVVTGPHSGHSIALPDGVSRVGSRAGADFILAGDHFLSGVHFAAGLRDGTLLLKDLGSLNGTLVKDERVDQARLSDGDWFQAGHSMFRVRLAEAPPPGASVLARPGPLPPRAGWAGPHRSPQLNVAQNRAMDVLATQTGAPFAILDAARDAKIMSFLESQAGQSQSLYEGEQAQRYARVAPYLVSLTAAASEQLILLGWQRSWGVFFHSLAARDEARRQLRHFLVAETPDGQRKLFRFYDPRVLRVYLATCEPSERADFFGSILSFVMEDEQPGRWVCFQRGARQLKTDYAVWEDEKTP